MLCHHLTQNAAEALSALWAVVGLVAPCASIADIGCDHGYVAIELISRCICQHVFAMDIHLGPLERAKHNIKEYRMQEYIETRQSNGMESLSKGEAEGVKYNPYISLTLVRFSAVCFSCLPGTLGSARIIG